MNASPPRPRRLPLESLLLALCLTLGAFVYGDIEKPSGWDDAFYLGQLSSLLEDGDLDLRNDALWMVNEYKTTFGLLTNTLPSGRLENTFSIGPAVAWAPAYLIGMAAKGLGVSEDPRRWGHAHVAAMSLLALALLGLTAWAARDLLRLGRLGPAERTIGVVALIFGSPLLVYAYRHYSGPHLISALAAFLVVGSGLRLTRKPTSLEGFFCGLALGLLFLTRWVDVILGAAPLAALVWGRGTRADKIRAAAAGFVGFALMASLQPHVWFVERGELFLIPQGAGYMRWTRPRILPFLFSGFHGLFPWSPIYLAGALGLVLPWRLRRPVALRWAALAVLIALVYVNACVADWWGHSSYGQRRMTSALPLVALGLANLSYFLPRRAVGVLLVLFIIWGVTTANLHRGLINDLRLAVTGEPSRDAVAAGPGEIGDAARARARLRPWPLEFSSHDLFAYSFKSAEPATRGATLVISAGILFGILAAPAKIKRRGLVWIWLGLAGVTVVGFHIRLIGRPERPAELDRRWREISVAARAGDLERAEALMRGGGESNDPISGDAEKFILMAIASTRGHVSESRRLAAELRAKEYQAMELLPR